MDWTRPIGKNESIQIQEQEVKQAQINVKSSADVLFRTIQRFEEKSGYFRGDRRKKNRIADDTQSLQDVIRMLPTQQAIMYDLLVETHRAFPQGKDWVIQQLNTMYPGGNEASKKLIEQIIQSLQASTAPEVQAPPMETFSLDQTQQQYTGFQERAHKHKNQSQFMMQNMSAEEIQQSMDGNLSYFYLSVKIETSSTPPGSLDANLHVEFDGKKSITNIPTNFPVNNLAPQKIPSKANVTLLLGANGVGYAIPYGGQHTEVHTSQDKQTKVTFSLFS